MMQRSWFDFKKFAIEFEINCRYVPSYVYACELGARAPYRFYFHPSQNRSMWKMVRSLRSRGLRVQIWRPPNPWKGLK